MDLLNIVVRSPPIHNSGIYSHLSPLMSVIRVSKGGARRGPAGWSLLNESKMSTMSVTFIASRILYLL